MYSADEIYGDDITSGPLDDEWYDLREDEEDRLVDQARDDILTDR